MTPHRPPAWTGSPLALQLMVLLLSGLVVAQAVTLALSVLLPPEPAPEYRLPEVAAALRGAGVRGGSPRPLMRSVKAAPPALRGPAWLVSEPSRLELARQLGADPNDVRLASYLPPPFAGAVARPEPARIADLEVGPEAASPFAGLLIRAAFAEPASGPPASRAGDAFPDPLGAPVGLPGDASGGLPTNRFGGRGSVAGRSRAGPTGAGLGGSRPDAQQESFRRRFDQQAARAATALQPRADPASARGMESAPATPAARADPLLGAVLRDGPAGRSRLVAPRPIGIPQASPAPVLLGTLGGAASEPAMTGPVASRVQPLSDEPPPAPEPARPHVAAARVAAAPPPHAAVSGPVQAAMPAPLTVAPPPRSVAAAPERLTPDPDGEPNPMLRSVLPAPLLALFRRPPAPFVQGDFVAAYRIGDERWAVVRPRPEPFPNSWQRRLMLWFALSFAIVAPLGLLYIRRIVKPLGAFALAAEQLGRDPSAPGVDLRGPAEVGRAARALNRMQARISRFVADRTAMIGAISHDLRTPLTRMRFRLEEAPDAVREGMLEEVEEMEAMISSVLDFLKQASEQGPRKAIDVAPLVEDVVEDFGLVGADVALSTRVPAVVEADALSIRRVVSNLVDNAVKYGERARVTLRTEADEAVIEVADDGPGLPATELDRVFQPFYRTASAETSGKRGAGLGLAACRSIARAHGGEVRFVRAGEGRSELRLPLSALPVEA